MYFLLNHATGALVISASNRDEALTWGHRQLGEQARRIFVLELSDDATPSWIERSGTGLELAGMPGCQPRVSLMADSMQRVSGISGEVIRYFEWHQAADLRGSCASIH